MKKQSGKDTNLDDLRSEYGPELFRNMKPNRFAAGPKLGRVHPSPAQSATKRSRKRDSSDVAPSRSAMRTYSATGVEDGIGSPSSFKPSM